MTTLGAIFPPSEPPEQLLPVARAADAAGLEQLWIWEDCFYEGGISTATAALGATENLVIGIGLLPVPLRNVALAAMEIATVERLFPGRLVPGIGHGVLEWMGQVGARAESPMTLLREYTAALRALLHGETVTTDGRYVTLDKVALDWAPTTPPPLLVGAVREKTMRLAGELADGVILTGETKLETVGDTVASLRADRPADLADPDVVAFVTVEGRVDAETVAARARAFADAGVTHVMLHAVGDDPWPLEEFVAFVANDVRALV